MPKSKLRGGAKAHKFITTCLSRRIPIVVRINALTSPATANQILARIAVVILKSWTVFVFGRSINTFPSIPILSTRTITIAAAHARRTNACISR